MSDIIYLDFVLFPQYVAAPVAVQAEGEVFASARIGLWNFDSGGTSDLTVRSFSSRFGAASETDLGNGMTGFGKYEWDVDFNNFQGEDDISVRQRYVGLKGDFGSLLIGQAWAHTFYTFAVAPNDNPWWNSGYAMMNYSGRLDNGITYMGSAGAINFGVTAFFVSDADEDAPDQTAFGASFAIGDMTLGAALQTSEAAPIGNTFGGSPDATDPTEDILGIALSGISLGDASLGLGLQTQDDDSSFVVDVGLGNIYVHIEQQSLDAADRDRLGITLGYTQSLGRKTTMYYEYHSMDNDTGNSDDDITKLMAVLKYDII